MPKVYIDSETCGLHSQMVLLQYAQEDGPITLFDVWTNPIRETLARIEWIAAHTVVGFNLAFDWFHLNKTYTIFRLADPDWIPAEHTAEIALLEPSGQDGPCVKPAGALDLLLHSRKGPCQSLMAREDVRIKRVPAVLAYALAKELEERVQLDGIYFAKSAHKDAPRWKVLSRKTRDGEVDEDFRDVVLKFHPSGSLKTLVEHALGWKPRYRYADVEPDAAWKPYELGYAPTALAVSSPAQNWEVWKTDKKSGRLKHAGRAWPAVIHKFIEHWGSRGDARDYARDDIAYTRALDRHFGFPAANDDDSVLACMVPIVRWRGFRIDPDGMRQLLAEAQTIVDSSPVNVNQPAEVRRYIAECLDEIEYEIIQESTKKNNLEKVAKYTVRSAEELAALAAAACEEEDEEESHLAGITRIGEIRGREECLKCEGRGTLREGSTCRRCEGRGHMLPGIHPAAVRAQQILDVKHAAKEVELYAKLLVAKKFHASFNVVGTLSSRMAGGDGLNAQGIKKTKTVRRMFPLAWEGYQLCGGDFDSFEVTLADAVYGDANLRADLLSRVPCHKCQATGAVTNHKDCKGRGCEACSDWPRHQTCDECDGSGQARKKIHALFAMSLYPGATYDQIVASDGSDTLDMYARGKSGVFGMVYGGDWSTLVNNLSIDEEHARAAFDRFNSRYPGVARSRQKTHRKFCSIEQPAGPGTAVIWAEPAEHIESFLGFRRYFTLENKICKALFDLARRPPRHWRDAKIKVVRTNRVQTAGGAVSSALYAAAFAMQAANMRAAANHEIQSPGGQITKAVERAIWDLQPAGVNELLVAPMNVHDELLVSTHPSMVKAVTEQVRTAVERYRPQVPLIGMSWSEDMANWAEKKGGTQKVKICSEEMLALAA